jgi:hypothetical protein
MSTQRTYSPKNVNALFSSLKLTGFAEGSFIQAVRSSDNSSSVVGSQGDVGLTVNADKTGTITFTLLQNSTSNATLSHVQNYQDINDELLRGDIEVSDPSGGYLCYAKGCHIMTPPEMNLADEQQSKVWVFFVENLQFANVGDFIDDASVIANAKSLINTLKGVAEVTAPSGIV